VKKPYEDVAAAVKAQTGAQGVVLIVFGGVRGSGAAIDVTTTMAALLPQYLRAVADELDRDARTRVQ